MARRCRFCALLAAALFVGFLVLNTRAAQTREEKGDPVPSAVEKTAQAMNRIVSLEFSHHTLLEVVERLRASTGLAFELDGKLTAAKIHNTDSQAPFVPPESNTAGYSCSLHDMKLRNALSIFLGYYGLDYAVLDSTIIIATVDRAHGLQMQQPVDLAVAKLALADALAQLSRQTATELLVDPRAAKQTQKQVTLRTQNMPLEKAVTLLAEFAGLKAVTWEKALLITTAEHAAQLRSERTTPPSRSTEQPKLDALPSFTGLGISGGAGFLGGFGLSGGNPGLCAIGQFGGLGVDPTPVPDRGPVRGAMAAKATAEQPPKKKKAKADSSARIRKLLSETVETKDFQNPMTLKEALGRFHEIFAARGFDLPVLVDVDAFREENPDGEPIYDTQIEFPPFPKQMTFATALRVMLSKVRTNNATYLVRPNHIEVTTYARSQAEAQTVDGTFIDRPLTEVLQDLSDQTGISIVVDARAGERALTKVTASLPPDTGLVSAVQVLADMADLKMIKVDNLLYITLRSNNANFPPSERPPRIRRLDAAAEQ